ncbi:MAG: hypothetical protein M1814_002330 [Vezdaea aestivalis]|nr:MAG: hypothetical protein M1814_002330 [Vezdaea aestivalis]
MKERREPAGTESSKDLMDNDAITESPLLISPYFSQPNQTVALPSRSPYFNQSTHLAILPSLESPRFGLIQEELTQEHFKLLVAVIFLNKTKGKYAIPVFRNFIQDFPSPESLAEAGIAEIEPLIHRLGLQRIKAKILIDLAQVWIGQPPRPDKRHRTLHYPESGDGSNIKPWEVVGTEDVQTGAWEIGHLPGVGPYALDSWRIFCRDIFRQCASGWNGEDAAADFEPEWWRVKPQDKELQAFLQWAWLREGFVYDPLSGTKRSASERDKSLYETNRNFQVLASR